MTAMTSSRRRGALRVALALALAASAAPAAGLIHKLDLSNDRREVFLIETFGFAEGGTADVSQAGASATLDGRVRARACCACVCVVSAWACGGADGGG